MENSQTGTGQKKPSRLNRKFAAFAEKTDNLVGSPYWFALSVLLVLIWIPSGYFLGFSEIWHLIINTTTTILTFLMLSLLHSSQQKWEDKIDKLLKREEITIKEIKKETDQMTSDSKSKPQPKLPEQMQ